MEERPVFWHPHPIPVVVRVTLFNAIDQSITVNMWFYCIPIAVCTAIRRVNKLNLYAIGSNCRRWCGAVLFYVGKSTITSAAYIGIWLKLAIYIRLNVFP